MTKRKILLQFDPDPQASVFDAVVAVDSGVEHLLQYASVEATQVRDLVHGAMFTRGPQDLASTAIFIGGSNVAMGETLLGAVKKCFFGPLRVSVMLDANGANTTAAAAVIAAGRHLDLKGKTVAVLGGTGPVGQRVARLSAACGANVRLASRALSRAQEAAAKIGEQYPQASVTGWEVVDSEQRLPLLEGASAVFAAGAAGVELLRLDEIEKSTALQVAIDLNAVPPLGIAGIGAHDKARQQGNVYCYGALGVGGSKMKIHRAAIEQLFAANDQILDAEEIFAIGQKLEDKRS